MLDELALVVVLEDLGDVLKVRGHSAVGLVRSVAEVGPGEVEVSGCDV